MGVLNSEGLVTLVDNIKGYVENNTVIDSTLSSTSVNPVQNKIIKNALDEKVPMTRTINNKALSSDITLSAADVGADTLGSATSALSESKEYTNKKVSEVVESTYTKSETDTAITNKVAEIVADAPEDFDTLKEMSVWIANHQEDASAMNSAITDNTKSISELNKSKADKTEIPTKVSELTNDSGYKTTDTNTTYTLTQDSTDGHKITLTPSSGTATTITIPDNNTWRAVQDNLTSTATDQSLSANQGYVLKKLTDGKLNKIKLSMQNTSYRRTVIVLCKLSASASSTTTYTSGRFYFKRSNGLYDAAVYDVSMEDAWNGDYAPKCNIFGHGHGTVKPCTFTYNGVQYGGLDVYISAAEANVCYFYGVTTEELTCIDYYDTYNNTALNTEINDSINYDNIDTSVSQLSYNDVQIATVNDTVAKANAVPWSGITDKPSTYPPSTHTHNYLPLSGGTMTGATNFTVNKKALEFRNGNENYYTHVSYQTSGNEALVFGTNNAVTSFIFANGENSTNISDTRWNSIVPGLQIKNNSVSIGKLIANGATPTHKLHVEGNAFVKDDLTVGSHVQMAYDSTEQCLNFNFI